MTDQAKQEEIRRLHAEFSSIVKYRDKVIFYDRFFGLFNYRFPLFDPELDMLFKPEKISVIVDLFEKERRSSFVPERKFSFADETFIFNVAPLNSNAEIFNDCIVSKFIESDKQFNNVLRRIKNSGSVDGPVTHKIYAKARNNISVIEEQIYGGNEGSLRSQFMTVFYQGYHDHRNNTFKKFPRRKKIIELYLYSQGVLYAKYIDAVNEVLLKQKDEPEERFDILDLKGRLILFRELGIVDLLKKKYKKLGQIAAEKKVAEIICLMLGENPSQADRVFDHLQAIGQQSAPA